MYFIFTFFYFLKWESFGEKFEILVDPDLAADFRNPDNEKEIEIEDILAVEEIFKDSKKGDKASEEAMEKVFGTTDVLEVASQILKKGHVQLTAEQRRQMQEDKRKQVIAKIAREGINPQNGLPQWMRLKLKSMHLNLLMNRFK